MKYNFVVVANCYEKVVIDNVELEFYRHIQNGSMDGEPVVYDHMAVSARVLDEDGNAIGNKVTSDLYDIGNTSFRVGTQLLVDVIDYNNHPVDVAVCDREYFGMDIWCDAIDGKVNITVETGLGKWLDTGCGAISHVDTDKLPPEVKAYHM